MAPVARAWDVHTGTEVCHRYDAYRYLANFASVERWRTLQDRTPIPGEVAYLVRRCKWLSDMHKQMLVRAPYLKGDDTESASVKDIITSTQEELGCNTQSSYIHPLQMWL